MKLKGAALRKLCLAGVISTLDYWKYKVLLRRSTQKIAYERAEFKLNSIPSSECLLLFRFYKHEIYRLAKAFNIPQRFKLDNRISYSGIEGLCVVLRRLSYPNRLWDLVKLFNRDTTVLSRIFKTTLNFLFENYAKRLERLTQRWLTLERMEEMARACEENGSYYQNLIGFIDGTARPICRPKYNQRMQYSGYKKTHCLKYQSIVFPNGIIGRLDGPFNGRRHDAAILSLSNLKSELGKLFVKTNGETFCLYGDPGYSNQRFIKVGFKNYTELSENQKLFNSTMSGLRVSVEYGFGKILQQFAFLDFKKNQKLYLQPLRKQYLVAALLVNCQTCMRGNQVSEYFKLVPPALEEYLE